jgi:hypothetical protein
MPAVMPFGVPPKEAASAGLMPSGSTRQRRDRARVSLEADTQKWPFRSPTRRWFHVRRGGWVCAREAMPLQDVKRERWALEATQERSNPTGSSSS